MLLALNVHLWFAAVFACIVMGGGVLLFYLFLISFIIICLSFVFFIIFIAKAVLLGLVFRIEVLQIYLLYVVVICFVLGFLFFFSFFWKIYIFGFWYHFPQFGLKLIFVFTYTHTTGSANGRFRIILLVASFHFFSIVGIYRSQLWYTAVYARTPHPTNDAAKKEKITIISKFLEFFQDTL